jgi:hypothetical protein
MKKRTNFLPKRKESIHTPFSGIVISLDARIVFMARK